MTRISGALLPTQLIVGALTWRYANRLAVARNAGLPVAAKISNQPRDLRLPGAIAQLEEHLLCKQGVRGSSPLSSTCGIIPHHRSQPGRVPFACQNASTCRAPS